MTATDVGHSARPQLPAKITAAHLAKLAIVYVRQSTPQQIAENRESLARQYALAQHATALVWPADRVVVIDDDLGLSGRTADGRPGFQRLLAEVTMDHVGLILGLEMSRLARSCKDWYQLLEVCAIFATLLADQDGLYDPADPNDPDAPRRLYQTTDGGQTWPEINTVAWTAQLDFVDPAHGWALARAGEEIALVQSANGGASWALLEPDSGP